MRFQAHKAVFLILVGFYFFLVSFGGIASGLQEETLQFAVIGDYGTGDQAAADVASMVSGWGIDLVISTGDNYYSQAWGKGGNGLNQYDNAVGALYCQFLAGIGQPDSGNLDCPAQEQSPSGNRFFPTIGNHDRSDTSNGLVDYLNYFHLPGEGFSSSSGSERYYDFVQGPVHFFALDSDTALFNEQDMAQQKAWLEAGLNESETPWQVVYFHHAAFSSAEHGENPEMQWPFAEWGADVIFQGHDHVYERIMTGDLLAITSGFGGRNLYRFGPAIPGSAARFNSGHGAVKVTASEHALRFEAWTTAGGQEEDDPRLVDCILIGEGLPSCPEPDIPPGEMQARSGFAVLSAELLGLGVLLLLLLLFIGIEIFRVRESKSI